MKRKAPNLTFMFILKTYECGLLVWKYHDCSYTRSGIMTQGRHFDHDCLVIIARHCITNIYVYIT